MTISWRYCRSLAGLSCLLFAVSACAFGGGIDNPVQQKFVWFSYLAGDDIREACAQGGPERYRLVYNARYDEQLRTYEVLADEIDGGGFLTARTQGQATVTVLRADDLLAPWRWQKAQARLEVQAMQNLRNSLDAAGFYDRPAVGLELNSKAFYWAAVGCRDGRFFFSGWQHPSDDFDNLAFPALLFAHDGTGQEVNPPRSLSPSELGRFDNSARSYGGVPRFLVTVREGGLSGGGFGL